MQPDDDVLFSQIYQEIKRRARQLRRDGAATLETTALVHEAWLKLHAGGHVAIDQRHLFHTTSLAMRQILIDHARARSALKRGNAVAAEALDTAIPADAMALPESLDLLALLDRLRTVDSRKAETLEWHLLGGASLADIACVHGVSEMTSKRDLRSARALLMLWAGTPATSAGGAG